MRDQIRATEKEDSILNQLSTHIQEVKFCQCEKCDWLNIEPEEHIFGLLKPAPNPQANNKQPETKPIFDVRKSNLWSLYNTKPPTGFDDEKIDEMLCERFGINVDSWQPEMETQYTPIGRLNPIDFEKMDYLAIYKIKIKGQNSAEQNEIRKIGIISQIKGVTFFP